MAATKRLVKELKKYWEDGDGLDDVEVQAVLSYYAHRNEGGEFIFICTCRLWSPRNKSFNGDT